MRVKVGELAAIDLRQIGRYGGRRWGRDRARQYAEAIQRQFALLGQHPEIGPVAENAPSFRLRAVGSHIIYYKLGNDEVAIVRILHSSQDADRHLP